MMTFVVGILLTLVAPEAQAGRVVGNGGDVLICPDQRALLLDYYESELLRDLSPDLGDEQLSVDEKVELILTRLERLDPERAETYRQWAASFADEKIMVNTPLVEIEDSGYIFRHADCEVKQIAEQRQPIRPLQKRYFISSDLWQDLASDDHRAGLILHEIIYRDALNRGHVNSIEVRYLTGLLSSRSFEQLDQSAYRAILRQTYFDSYAYSHTQRYGTFDTYHGMLRYFPDVQVNYQEATAFCSSTPDVGIISSLDIGSLDFYLQFARSPVGQKILGVGGDGTESVWIDMPGMLNMIPSKLEITGEPSLPQREHLETKLKVFCWEQN